MARLNLEDSIYTDIRFTDLVQKLGNLDTAIGALIRAWSLAQKYFLNEDTDRLIPLEEWNKQRMRSDLIDVGFAEIREKGIYVAGSKDQFAWLLQKQSAGKKSVESRSTHVNTRQHTLDFVERPSTSFSISSSFSNSNNQESSNEDSFVAAEDRAATIHPSFADEPEISAYVRKRKVSLGSQKAWLKLYPIDYIRREFIKAAAWLNDNPSRMPKSGRGSGAFISRWLDKGFEAYRKSTPTEKMDSRYNTNALKKELGL